MTGQTDRRRAAAGWGGTRRDTLSGSCVKCRPSYNDDDGDEASVKHLDWRLEPAAKSFSLSPSLLLADVAGHRPLKRGRVGSGMR